MGEHYDLHSFARDKNEIVFCFRNNAIAMHSNACIFALQETAVATQVTQQGRLQ